jgi:hypothetical protein
VILKQTFCTWWYLNALKLPFWSIKGSKLSIILKLHVFIIWYWRWVWWRISFRIWYDAWLLTLFKPFPELYQILCNLYCRILAHLLPILLYLLITCFHFLETQGASWIVDSFQYDCVFTFYSGLFTLRLKMKTIRSQTDKPWIDLKFKSLIVNRRLVRLNQLEIFILT